MIQLRENNLNEQKKRKEILKNISSITFKSVCVLVT